MKGLVANTVALKQPIGLFLKNYPWRTFFTISALLVAGIAEGIGIVTLLPLFEIAANSEAAAQSEISLMVYKLLASVNLEPNMTSLLLLIVAGILLKGVFLLAAMFQVGYTVAQIMTDFRLQFLNTLMNAKWSHYVNKPTGHFINTLNFECTMSASLYNSLCQVCAALIQATVYIILVFTISFEIATVAVLAALILVRLMNFLVMISKRAGIRQTELMKSLNARLTDVIQGMKPIKAMHLENQISPFLENETRDLNAVYRSQVAATESLKVMHEPIVTIMLAGGIYVAIVFANMQLSALLVLAFMFHRVMTRVHTAQQYFQSVMNCLAAYQSFHHTLNESEEQAETLDKSGAVMPVFHQEIRFDNVVFSYTQDKPVLKGASLSVKAGSIVSIIGASGIGKTTIADLLLGLYKPESGKILIDETDLADIKLGEWRYSIGYVPQEMTLFHDTILNNLTFGQHIDDSIIQHALEAAGAIEFVMALPDKLETVVGEKGARLSGGQRQRLSIARALVRKPRLMILDEVTTALDPDTEKALCKTLESLKGEVTILAISHQKAITEISDVVYQMSEGRLIASKDNASSTNFPAYQ